MVTYTDFIDIFGDVIEEEEFQILEDLSLSFLQSYCESFIFKDDLKENFDDYGLDIEKALLYQISFVGSNGGVSCYEGSGDFQLQSVSTSGFNYKYSNGKAESVKYYNGIPIAPVARNLILSELRKKNYLSRCIRRWEVQED